MAKSLLISLLLLAQPVWASPIIDCKKTKDELYQVACVTYYEARGTPKEDQLLVARAVVSRASHGEFPSTISDVIRQKNAFTHRQNRTLPVKDLKSFNTALEVAAKALSLPPTNVVFFHDKSISKPSWKNTKLYKSTKHFKFYSLED